MTRYSIQPRDKLQMKYKILGLIEKYLEKDIYLQKKGCTLLMV